MVYRRWLNQTNHVLWLDYKCTATIVRILYDIRTSIVLYIYNDVTLDIHIAQRACTYLCGVHTRQ